MPTQTSAPALADYHQPNGLVALLAPNYAAAHFGVVQVSGADAHTFLQGQLSNDISALTTHSCLAAWCDAKGRMLASMIVLREPQNPEAFLLLCRHDLLPLIMQRLRMFILRSKVTLTDVSHSYTLYGALGTAAQQLCNQAAHTATMPQWHVCTQQIDNTAHSCIALPHARALYLLPSDAANPLSNTHTMLDIQAWLWAEIASGVVLIEHASSGSYIPQMLNYESVGGVDFRKGCYPGQEVVARTQFRGVIKRRAYIVSSTKPIPLAIGDAIWCATHDAPDDGFECGTVVQCAHYSQTTAAFVILPTKVAAQCQAQQASLYTQTQHGLQWHPLPYDLRTKP